MLHFGARPARHSLCAVRALESASAGRSTRALAGFSKEDTSMRKRMVSCMVLLLAVSSAGASDQSRTPGSSLNRISGIVAFRITILSNEPAVTRLTLKHESTLFGPTDGFEVKSDSPVWIVRDMLEGSWEWYDMLSTVDGRRASLKRVLGGFKVAAGCITYAGSLVIDLRVRPAH